MRRLVQIAVPALVLLAAIALRTADPPILSEVRLRAFDVLQNVQPRPAGDAPVRIVTVDDESLERLGQWPWPRTILARIIANLRDAGAAAIALDLLLVNPDRTSPASLADALAGIPAGLAEALRALPDHDDLLTREIEAGGVVTAFTLRSEAGGVPPERKAGVAFVGEHPGRYVASFPGVLDTLPGIVAAADGHGAITIVPDRDAIVRRVPLVVAHGDAVFPALSVEALRVAQGASSVLVKGSGAAGEDGSGADTGILGIRVGAFAAQTDPHGRLLLYDSGPRTEWHIPAWRVAAGEFDPAEVEGRIVFVGTSATGLSDHHATPISARVPGVEAHAQVVEQIVQGVFLERPTWAEGLEILMLFTLGLLILLSWGLPAIGSRWSLVVGGLVIAGGCAFAVHSFVVRGFLLDPVTPTLFGAAIYGAAAITSFVQTEGARRFLRRAFAQYLAPELVEQLAADPSRLRLGGEARELTVLVADIRDFTTLTERLHPETMPRILKHYFTPMTRVLHEHGAAIDKFMGDGVMCFWNAPLDDPDHARNACRAALGMHRCLADEVNPAVAEIGRDTGEDILPLRIGIGITTGTCIVGNMGSEQKFAYSPLGDSVNLAARLEGETKTYGAPTIVDEDTARAVPDFAFLDLDVVRVKGKTRSTRILALVGDEEVRRGEAFAELALHHERLLACLRAGDRAAALERLEACRGPATRLGVERIYERYEAALRKEDAEPGAPGWTEAPLAATK